MKSCSNFVDEISFSYQNLRNVFEDNVAKQKKNQHYLSSSTSKAYVQTSWMHSALRQQLLNLLVASFFVSHAFLLHWTSFNLFLQWSNVCAASIRFSINQSIYTDEIMQIWLLLGSEMFRCRFCAWLIVYVQRSSLIVGTCFFIPRRSSRLSSLTMNIFWYW